MSELKQPFARNRAEEAGHDLWRDFVIPPFFDGLEFGEQKKPFRFVGGRGCGKTTLLRYLSHRTQFSELRPTLDDAAFANIGLYYRADTQYLSIFTGGGLDERKWLVTFEHAVCLALAEELLDCVRKLVQLPERIHQLGGIIGDIDFDEVVDFDPSLPTNLDDLYRAIRRKRNELSAWLNNIDVLPPPVLYPLKTFLTALIERVREAIPLLKNTLFNVFVDEYENLLDYQQRLINTLIKHSEEPLVFHIAIKKNGMRTSRTLGNESIQEKDDFRTIDIEDRLEGNFDLFAAELMFFRLIQRGIPEDDTPVRMAQLRSRAQLDKRLRDEAYRSRVLQGARKIFPSLAIGQIASLVLTDDALKKQLYKYIESGIKKKQSNRRVEEFIDHEFPEATIACAALLHQVSKTPDEVLKEFQLHKAKKSTSFPEWIHKYLHPVLFLLWAPLQRPCLLYAGFDAFLQLSKLNVRHFLELCHLSLAKVKRPKDLTDLLINPEDQAQAAREASTHYFKEIQGAGDYGNRLYSVVETLGQLFQLSQERRSQSEPEKTHFSIAEGDELSEDGGAVLREATKWSILFDQKETKVKSKRLESTEYLLNPIFAPYFGISYRKGRRLELAAGRANALLTGTQEDLAKIIKDYKREWFKDERNDQLSLIDGDEQS